MPRSRHSPSSPRRAPGRAPGRAAGFALLMAMGAALTLALLASQVSGTARARLSVSAGVEVRARAQAAADGAVRHAAALLRAGEAPGPPPPEARFGATITLEAASHAGRASVHTASERDLRAAAALAGLAEPGAFAEAVLARRAALAAAGVSWRLDARAFQAEADLLALVPAPERAALAEAVTVHPPGEDEAVWTLRATAVMPAGARAERRAVVAVGPGIRPRVLEWE